MSTVPITLHQRKRAPRSLADAQVAPLEGRPSAEGEVSPLNFLLDDIARAEWERVLAVLPTAGPASVARLTLLAGYCNAVARAVRAEQALAAEGQYYLTTTEHGSLIRRRHPALHDAEQGWTSARHLARQLGITGGAAVEHGTSGARRSLFK